MHTPQANTERWPLSSRFRSIVVINQLKWCLRVCLCAANRVYQKLSFKCIHTFIMRRRNTQAICHIIIFYVCSFNKRNLCHIISAYAGVEKLAESDKFNIYVDRTYTKKNERNIHRYAWCDDYNGGHQIRSDTRNQCIPFIPEVKMATKLIEMAFYLLFGEMMWERQRVRARWQTMRKRQKRSETKREREKTHQQTLVG